MRALLLALCGAISVLGQAGNPLAARAGFAGTYRNDDLKLDLRAASAAQYSGTIEFKNQSFPVTARETGQQLSGIFESGGNRFSFTATRDGSRLRFVTDGTEYVLDREGAPPAPAQPSAPSVPQTSAGTGNIYRHPSGMTLRPPPGWTTQDGPAGVILVPQGTTFDPNGDEVYLAAINEGYQGLDDPRLLAELQEGFGAAKLGAGQRTPLPLSGNRQGLKISWQTNHPDKNIPMTIRLFLVPVTGRVTSVVAVGPSQRVAQFDQQLTMVAQSLAFDVKAAEAAAAGLSDGAADSQAWLAKLRGKLLTQMSSSTGFASKKVISLSADGAYTYNSDSLLSINVGEYGQAPSASASSGGRKADGGKWRIVTRGGQTYLELRSAQGPVTHIQLSRQGNTTLLDGVRTFVTDP